MEDKCVFLFKSYLTYGYIAKFNGEIITSYTFRIFESGKIVKSTVGTFKMHDYVFGTFPELAKKISAIIESHAETINKLKGFYYSGGYSDPTYETFGFGDIQIEASNIMRFTDEEIEDLRIRNVPGHEEYIEDIKKAALLLDIYDEIAEEYNKYVPEKDHQLQITKPETESGTSRTPGVVNRNNYISEEERAREWQDFLDGKPAPCWPD